MNFKLQNMNLKFNSAIKMIVVACLLLQIGVAQSFLMQGVLKDQYGKSLNGFNAVTFKLYEIETGGAHIWTEVHPSVLAENGLFTIELGSIISFGELMFDQNYW